MMRSDTGERMLVMRLDWAELTIGVKVTERWEEDPVPTARIHIVTAYIITGLVGLHT